MSNDPQFDALAAQAHRACKMLDDVIEQRDKLKASNAGLVTALKNMIALVDHFKEYPKCKATKFFFGRSEHSDITDARETLEGAKP